MQPMNHPRHIAGDELWQAVHQSGMSVSIIRRPGFSQAHGVVSVAYGANDTRFLSPCGTEHSVPAGTAHFLEHMIFSRQSGSLPGYFARYGATIGGITTSTSTDYDIRAGEGFTSCLADLLRFVLTPDFTDQLVAREQSIIEREIPGPSSPLHRVRDNLLKAIYQVHPTHMPVVGTHESIRGITSSKLQVAHQNFYRPPNVSVAAIGDLDPEMLIESLCEVVTSLSDHTSLGAARYHWPEPATVCSDMLIERTTVPVPYYAIGIKEALLGKCGTELLRQRILTELALEAFLGATSELNYGLRDAGLLSSELRMQYHGFTDFGYTLIYGNNSASPERLWQELQNGRDRTARDGFSGMKVERAKKILLGRYLKGLDNSYETARAVATSRLDGTDFYAYLTELSLVKEAEITTRFREYFRPEQMSVSLLLPE